MPKRIPTIYFHVGDLTDLKQINDIEDTIISIQDQVSDCEISLAKSSKDLIKLLMSDNDSSEVLVVFRIGYCMINNLSIEKQFSIIESAKDFTDKKIKIAPIIYAPMSRSFLNDLKQNDIVGFIPAIQKFDPEESRLAWESLTLGEEYFPECVTEKDVRSAKKNQQQIKLTARQTQILELISHRGLSNKKIAQHLKISESTVKVHMSAILKAYGLRNRTQLALAGGRGLTA